MDNKVDTLQKFGLSFQLKSVFCLLNDKTFLDQVFDLLKKEYWESESHRWIVDNIIKYYEEYKSAPKPEYFSIQYQSITLESLKKAIKNDLKKILTEYKSNDDDLKYIKKEFLTFCKNQRLKSAIVKSVEYLEKGQYDSIKHEVDEALKAGMDRNIGHIYFEQLSDRIDEKSRNIIPTGWDVLNNIIGGGLGSGDLGVVVACSGFGKSWFLAHIGLSALKQGKRVVHYTTELSEEYLGLRYDTLFTQYPMTEIKENEEHVDYTIKQYAEKGADLVLRSCAGATTNWIKANIEEISRLRKKPDLIIVDYPDDMTTQNSRDDEYKALGELYVQLKNLATELQVPCWVASQAGRGQAKNDVIESDGVSDSYMKTMKADFMMSISRRIEDKLKNTGRVHIAKNRLGPDGMTFPAKINTSTGEIDLFDQKSDGGVKLLNEMADGQKIIKESIKSRFQVGKK